MSIQAAHETRFPAGRSVRLAVALGPFVIGLAFGLVVPASASPGESRAESANEAGVQLETIERDSAPIRLAQASDPVDESGRSRRLEPRYQPREPEPKSWYNSDYIFGITRSVADSTIAPAGKVPLFVLTVPLDLAFLPFSVIGGMFG